jgi:hypothetical protein
LLAYSKEHSVTSLFSVITKELKISQYVISRWKDIYYIFLYFVSCLFLLYVALSISKVCAKDNNIKNSLYNVVQTKATENNEPALSTEAVSRLIKQSKDFDKAIQTFNWSDMDGFQIAHLPSEELGKIKDLAVRNDFVIQAAMQVPKNTSSIQVDATASSSRFIEGISYTCLVGIDWRVKKEMYFTYSSGGSISVKEACRLFAWVSAANGIRFTRAKDKSRVLVIEYTGE